MDTRQIIDYAFNDDAKGMRDALYSNLHDRVMAHIEAHKQQIAQTMITQESEEDDVVEVEDTEGVEDSEEEMEDDDITEGKIDDLRDKKAAEKDADWWGDRKKKPTKKPDMTVRAVAGKSDSAAKHDEDDEDEKKK